jgi:hypothetical protein
VKRESSQATEAMKASNVYGKRVSRVHSEVQGELLGMTLRSDVIAAATEAWYFSNHLIVRLTCILQLLTRSALMFMIFFFFLVFSFIKLRMKMYSCSLAAVAWAVTRHLASEAPPGSTRNCRVFSVRAIKFIASRLLAALDVMFKSRIVNGFVTIV